MEKRISIIGVPTDHGQRKPGVDMGPRAIRYAGVVDRLKDLGNKVLDRGDVVIPSDTEDKEKATDFLKNIEEVISINESVANLVDAEVTKGNIPLILGGDHSIALGSIAGVTRHYQNLGVIWYDAHGDLNTADTSPSGNIHGMPLAASMGIGDRRLTTIYGNRSKVNPEHVVIIGARDLDPGEKELIQKEKIKVYTMREVDRVGIAQVMEETIAYLKERTDGVHLSFDLDGLDPKEAPGVGTPVAGGLTHRESDLAMQMLHEAGVVTSAEFVEVNPILDVKNKTAIVAVDLICSLFGKKLK